MIHRKGAMTSDALGPVRRSYSTAARPGAGLPRLKASAHGLDAAADAATISPDDRQGQHPGSERESPPQDQPAPPPPPGGDEPHPLLYMAVDTVTGEVLWQVQGDTVPVEPSERLGAYGPQGQFVYRPDPDDEPHGVSKLV